MKRGLKGLLVGLMLVLLLQLALVGVVSAKDGGFHIALLNANNTNAWRIQMEDNMKKVVELYKEQGLISKYDVFVADDDATKQSQQMRQLLNTDVDAIIILPVSATALTPVINMAVQKGILVMGIDMHIQHPDVISVTNNQYEWARIQAEWLAAHLGYQGDILWFDAIAGAPANEVRHKAWEDVLARYPKINVLKQVNANWSEGKAKELMSRLLSVYPDYDGILTQDGHGVGIIEACEQAGEPYPEYITSDEFIMYLRKWREINKDNPDNPMESIIVENPPGIGADGLMIAVRLLQGKELKDGVLETHPMDPDNKNNIFYQPRVVITRKNLEEWYLKTKDLPDTYFIDSVMPEDQVDKYFK